VQQTYRLIGSNPSPYSVKMRALMRYRRLPFFWEWRSPKNMEETRNVKPQVIPILQYPDGSFRNDSTFVALDLEQRHKARSVLPEDVGLRFLTLLVEDMADEWGTKCMFHYRWFYAADQDFCSKWIAGESGMGLPYDKVLERAEFFAERQVGRMALVGCTPHNRPVIEESYLRVLRLMEEGLKETPFIFGGRPTLADFGWFGQLFQLFMDPTPSTQMRLTAPKVYRWVPRLDDCSGVDAAAPLVSADALSPMVMGFLRLAGELYLPFLAANAQALQAGAEEVSLDIWGQRYSQAAFRYQGKCYDWLKSEFAKLDGAARAAIEPALQQSGCLAYLL
jgi:glutathione S-transferase